MMKSNLKNTDLERKSLLSTLWVFVLLNMVYADILGMLRPGYLDFLDQMSQQLSGSTVLLFAVFIMEVAIAMILLSRVLAYNANRWAHFINAHSGIIHPGRNIDLGQQYSSKNCLI